MGFAVGLIAFLAAFGASLLVRLRSSWRGKEERTPDGVVHEFAERRHRRRLRGILVAVAAPEELRFVLRPQNALDRWSKTFGLAVEFEVRDAGFDRTLYLESDLRALGALLASDAELRSALLSEFRTGSPGFAKLSRIRCARGRLWAEFDGRDEESLAKARLRMPGVLAKFAERLRRVSSVREHRRDPIVVRAAVLGSVSTASAALGVLGLVRAVSGRSDVLDLGLLFGCSALAGAVALAAFVLVVLLLLGRSSRTHLVLAEVLLAGGFGFVLSSFGLAREIDVELDSRPAETVVVRGASAEHRTSRSKGRTRHHYSLALADWRPGHEGEPLKLDISSDEYQRLRNHDAVALAIKPGTLGFAWVQSIEPR
jgi:hypothetical protein